MALRNTSTRFGLVTKSLHWLIAIHMIGLIAVGWWMMDLDYYSMWYYWAPLLHQAFGVIVFILGVALLIWRTIGSHPEALPGHAPYERIASRIAHWVLMTSVIAIPISGYVFITSNGESVDIFGVMALPAFFKVSDVVRDWATDFHIYASYGLLVVIAAHAGGTLKHHFWDRDSTLKRMTFSGK